jgi:hypothetical protein
MAQWEYCTAIWIENPAFKTGIQNLKLAQSQTLSRERSGENIKVGMIIFLRSGQIEFTTERTKVVTQLGLDGWELVSVTAVGTDPVTEKMYFKRPLA